MRREVRLRRSDAAKILEEISGILSNNNLSPSIRMVSARDELRRYGLLGETCPGAAHENEVHSDNCLTCAPHWGVVVPKVVVR